MGMDMGVRDSVGIEKGYRQSGFTGAWLFVPFVVAIAATIGIVWLRGAMVASSEASVTLARLEADVNRQLVEEEGVVNLGVVGGDAVSSLVEGRIELARRHLDHLESVSAERLEAVRERGLPDEDASALSDTYQRLHLSMDTELRLAEEDDFRQAWQYAYRITAGAHTDLDATIRSANRFFESRASQARWWADAGTFAMVMIALAVFVVLRHSSERERRAYERKLRAQALHDPLTGLANRTLLQIKAEQALSRRGGSSALLFIDLDGFKQINDTHGHEVGDHVLTTVASRLETQTRAGDTVARLGGDEFAILLEDAAAGDPPFAAMRFVGIIEQPIQHGDLTLRVGASVGIAESEEGTTHSDLIARADNAMYENKRVRKSVADPDSGLSSPLGAAPPPEIRSTQRAS